MKTNHVIAAVVAAVAVLSLVGGAAAQLETVDARLAIDQPHYIEDGVQTTDINGTQAYVVHGPEHDLHPLNFDVDDVTDYGVSTSAGQLEYNDRLGTYTFQSGGETGTFELYWVVQTEQTTVVNNTTQTQEVSLRYETLIRVAGQADMVHQTQAENQRQEHYMELGEEVNATIMQVREDGLIFAPDEGSDFEIYEAMLTRYIATGDPIQAFTGNYTQIWLLVLLSPGGYLFLAQFLGIIVWLAYKRYQSRSESIDRQSIEGSVSEKLAALDDKERRQAAANLDWNDEFPDSVARGFRESLGENPYRGWLRVRAALQPKHLVRDRLQAMSQCGYVGVPTTTTPDAEPETIDIYPETDVEDGVETIALDDLTDEELEAVDWDDAELRNFDLPEADYDASEIDDRLETADLEALVEELDVEMQYFDDLEEFGHYLHEFIASIREHPITDEHGYQHSTRATLELLLEKLNLMDREGLPTARYLADAVEAAIRDYDRGDRAEQYVEEVQDGATH